MSEFEIGIDIGGTHTDLTVVGDDVRTYKVATTPTHPTDGVLRGVHEAADDHGLTHSALLGNTDLIVHGTTVTTNALLEGEEAKTGLLVTSGFRDVMEFNIDRDPDLFDLWSDHKNPDNLILPRYLRRPVSGRIDKTGAVLEPIDEDEVRTETNMLADEGVESLAIAFMNAYLNDDHEQRAAELVREVVDVPVSVSSTVSGRIGLYDRTVSTVINASLSPVLRDYLTELESGLSEAGFDGVFLIMKSNGGVSSASELTDRPITTLNSGPAAAAVGAVEQASLSGYEGIISLDMGGTSCDVCLIEGQSPPTTTENEVGEVPVPISMVDINTIGAGGGSIVRIDSQGVLQVGPESAGADPGPVCYDQGGERPTVTDINLLLGYLNPDFFLGGSKQLNTSKARTAIERQLAEPLDLSPVEIAAGFHALTVDQLTNQIHQVSVQRGYDPREFTLMAVGGAGPIYAAALARRLETTAVVPESGGTLSAFGLLQSDIKHDFVRSIPPQTLSPDVISRLETLFDGMEAEARDMLREEGIPEDRWRLERSLDTRYAGQVHEVEIEIDSLDLTDIEHQHHREHEQLYTFRDDESPVEVVNTRLSAVAVTEKPQRPSTDGMSADRAVKEYREVYDDATEEFTEAPIYDGETRIRDSLSGPAVVEFADTTIVIPSDVDVTVDDYGNYNLHPHQS